MGFRPFTRASTHPTPLARGPAEGVSLDHETGREAVNICRRRCLRVAASVAILVAFPQIASAQSFPSRPITIVVPFSAGTGADIVARTVGERLAKALRQQILVDNRLGANGVVAASYVARAAPDGYTLLMATNTAFSANPSLMKNISYDPIRDFAPI